MNEHDLSRRAVLTLVGWAAVAITQKQSRAYIATRSTAKLFTTEVGTGKDVMLLHGWSCDLTESATDQGALNRVPRSGGQKSMTCLTVHVRRHATACR
jgi:hypothetical protein